MTKQIGRNSSQKKSMQVLTKSKTENVGREKDSDDNDQREERPMARKREANRHELMRLQNRTSDKISLASASHPHHLLRIAADDDPNTRDYA